MADKADEEIKVVVEQTGHKSEYYREIIPDSFWGGVRTGYIEAVPITSEIDTIKILLNEKQHVEHIAEISIKFTPQMAKKFIRWMTEKLIIYEKAFGKTILEEEIHLEKIKVSKEEIDIRIDELLNMRFEK